MLERRERGNSHGQVMGGRGSDLRGGSIKDNERIALASLGDASPLASAHARAFADAQLALERGLTEQIFIPEHVEPSGHKHLPACNLAVAGMTKVRSRSNDAVTPD